MIRTVQNISFIALCLFLTMCNKEKPTDTAKDEDALKFEVPFGFPEPVYSFEDNPLSQRKFELGKKLFYDPILSRDNTISCESCHKQFGAFSDPAHSVHHGVEGRTGTRNAPPMFNLAWHKEFMWDGGVNHLEVLSIAPITNPIEMDEDMANVIDKLSLHPTYPTEFEEAFGSPGVTSERMLKAMTQFMALLVSANSRYDVYISGNTTALTDEEVSGMKVYQENCAFCHKGILFTDFSYRNNGLDALIADLGREMITQDPKDRAKFKVPTLRNLERTPPYMHDGRFDTLEEVIAHYTSGVRETETLDPLLKNGDQLGIPLTELEQKQLIAFLKTLTDVQFITDPAFATPFE